MAQINFFLPIIPPTITHQQKKATVRKGKPAFYEPPELADARQKLSAYLSPFSPDVPLTGPLQLITKWCYPISGKHQNGQYKITKPDVDNSVKLFLDCCTALGFWEDDALVASLVVEKFWAEVPGIYVCIRKLPEAGK
jgi:Holliday junction resolvase RusA-like endonuclease